MTQNETQDEQAKKATQHYINNILNLSIAERYDYFIQICVDDEKVWTNYDEGYVSFEDNDGNMIFPVYPSKELAFYCHKQMTTRKQFETIPMTLEAFMTKCIPDMTAQKVYFGVICHKDGYLAVPAPQLLEDLQQEIEFVDNDF